MIQGCYDLEDKFSCDSAEGGRMEMNRDQPKAQYNYTEVGFKKLRLPQNTWELLLNFWQLNKENAKKELVPGPYTYTNHWDSPTYMVSVEDNSLKGAGSELKEQIWEGVKPILEEWVGRKLVPSSLYGIRIYKENAVLATHVDRLPLVTSCIINVDQDVNEDWPIEVYDHAGRAHNVTMKPGDMVLYESSTVLHGRPAPLNGKFYANIFVHFEPIDHKEMNRKFRLENGLNVVNQYDIYVSDNHNNRDDGDEFVEGITPQSELHEAAALGDLPKVKSLLERNRELLHAVDQNQWQPLHEAARGGNTEVVKFLIENGADIGARTSNGGTALWWARKMLDAEHSLIRYLEEIGAPEEGEDL